MTNNVPMEMRPSPIDDYKSNGDESMSNEFEKDFQRPTNPVGWRSEAEPEKEHLLQRAFEAERLVEKLRDELNVMQDKVNLLSRTTNHSVQMTFQEDSERKLREKLELELASKEHQIATLTLDRDKLQSTLNQISDLEKTLNEREKLIGELKCKLQNQADYHDIKRELNTLKSFESSSSHLRLNDDGPSAKTSFDITRTESSPNIKSLSTDVENPNNNSTSLAHSCRHCSSPCLHRHPHPPLFPIPSLLSSSASSSSNSSSSPSSPSQIFLKAHPSLLATHENDENGKFLPPLPSSTLTNKDNLSLIKYPSAIPSSCSTIVTPTASLLSSVTTTTTTLTPSNLFAGPQISSVQCTKLHCPPTSSWSPPLSSSSDLSTSATTSTDNSTSRTVIKPSKQSSPKSSPSPTILAPSSCPPMSTSNHTLEPLDTSYVANVVRKLLAQHNIGQRIFAKYILSLSQGTVSELLSKPKSWSKLTEKGKESYRKMWCWANSEESILALKSISPRKGMQNRTKENPYPAVNTKHTDPSAQQKIVQILADAQKQQMATGVSMDQKGSSSPCSSFLNDSSHANLLSNPFESKSLLSQTPSSSSSNSSADSSAANSPLNDSNAADQQSLLHPVPPPPVPSSAAPFSMLSAFVPSLLMRASNGMNSDNTDNYRNWLMLQEIVRNNDLLKQFKPVLPPPIDTDESEQENEQDDEEEEQTHEQDNEDEQQHQDDADDPEGTSATAMNDEDEQDEEDNPLDLSMKIDPNSASDYDIASSNSTNGKTQHQQQQNSSMNKHTKTPLPPLREQDTMKYAHINTIELVQTVKDILSRYSISQRHFGEKILGLSQGSVSDILARPKPWELLTQKGREPFLRMRLFLDDPNAIKQLIQTVSTAPATTPASILVPTFYSPLPPPSSILASNPSLLSNPNLNGFHSSSLLSRDHSIESQTNLLTNETTTSILPANDHSTVLPSSSASPSNGSINLTSNNNNNKSKSRSKSAKTTNDKPATTSTQSKNSLMTPYELPKIPLPSTIDTEQLSSQVRELLFAYSIGQRVFGEAVLNLSQGTVSEILSKPRPWHSLSVKGREPYIRMYTWFHDPGNVQKLLAWKKERDALRRARPATSSTSSSVSAPTSSANDSTGIDQESRAARPKRRSLFTDSQRRIFKQIFNNDPYPSQMKLEQLANEMSLPLTKVANWFHNARMRAKLHLLSSSSPTNILASSPVHIASDQLNSDDDELLDDNNNNPNHDEDEEEEDEEMNNDEDYPLIPTIVPVTSSWLNGNNDSNSSNSPIALPSTSTNIVSLIDERKVLPMATMSSSSSVLSSSSSKKRKSVPQKIITNHTVKKFNNDSTIVENETYNTSSNDETSTAAAAAATNSSATVLDLRS